MIENEMFRPAAEHQKKYLTPQLYNHEVAICTSIAAIGIAINDDDYQCKDPLQSTAEVFEQLLLCLHQ